MAHKYSIGDILSITIPGDKLEEEFLIENITENWYEEGLVMYHMRSLQTGQIVRYHNIHIDMHDDMVKKVA